MHCKECGLPIERGHIDWCSAQPLETQVLGLRKQVERYRKYAEHSLRSSASNRSMAAIWEGKFHQVKRENNALRRKLYRQGKSQE